jgi:hypothetical protein
MCAETLIPAVIATNKQTGKVVIKLYGYNRHGDTRPGWTYYSCLIRGWNVDSDEEFIYSIKWVRAIKIDRGFGIVNFKLVK